MDPFLKWAGGKRWLAKRWAGQLGEASKGLRYIEPFLGSGACFFALSPANAILSDVNEDLILTYKAIREEWREVDRLLKLHAQNHSLQHYYETRAVKPTDALERAAWFLYLNRSCFNGIYRVNRKGVFNVPKGDKSKIILETDDLEMTSSRLTQAEILCCDFEATIDKASAGDFVFADPPYTVMHNVNGFVKYNEKIFSWSDQVRLSDAVVRAAARGAKVLISNADHSSVRDLYLGSRVTSLARPSVIGGGGGFRKKTSELLIMLGDWPATLRNVEPALTSET